MRAACGYQLSATPNKGGPNNFYNPGRDSGWNPSSFDPDYFMRGVNNFYKGWQHTYLSGLSMAASRSLKLGLFLLEASPKGLSETTEKILETLSILNEGGPGLETTVENTADAFEQAADSLSEEGHDEWVDSYWDFSASDYHTGDAPYIDGKGFSP